MNKHVRYYESEFRISGDTAPSAAIGKSDIGIPIRIEKVRGGYKSSIWIRPFGSKVETMEKLTLRRGHENNITIEKSMEPVIFSTIEEAAETTARFLHEKNYSIFLE